MTSPHDEIDDWLSGEVHPLNPPPDSFDRIRRQARHRKTRQAAFAAAGCAVVVAAAVAVPQFVGGTSNGGSRPPLAASTSSPVQPSTSHSPASSGAPAVTSSAPMQSQQGSRLSITTSGEPPPPRFRPTSVTFVGTGSDSVVGAVIGQAGPPCATVDCTSLAGTSNYGNTWYGVSAPLAPQPNGNAGVSQLRFANLKDGWAFGPALFATSSGGWPPWHKESTNGQRVIDIEAAADGPALGLFAACTGSGPHYAADCTSFSLYTSVAGSQTWTPVIVPAGSLSTGQAGSASLVVSGRTGYVLAPTAEILTGSVSGGTWQRAGRAPCAPGPAQASGLPSQALLATSPHELLLACASGGVGPSGQTTLYTSATGSTWQLAGPVPHAGPPTSLASGAAGQVVVATAGGIYQSANSGKTWHQASLAGATPVGGFSYIGMTNGTDGVAIPADAALGLVYVSTDGGLHWQQRPITG